MNKNKESLIKEAKELFNQLYPSKTRCGISKFDEGRFEQGFIEGFLSAKNIIT